LSNDILGFRKKTNIYFNKKNLRNKQSLNLSSV